MIMGAGMEMEIPPKARLEQAIKKIREMLGIFVDLIGNQFEQALVLSENVRLVIEFKDGKLTVTFESSNPNLEHAFSAALHESLESGIVAEAEPLEVSPHDIYTE